MAGKKKDAKLSSTKKDKQNVDDDMIMTLMVWHDGLKLRKRFEKVKRVSFR